MQGQEHETPIMLLRLTAKHIRGLLALLDTVVAAQRIYPQLRSLSGRVELSAHIIEASDFNVENSRIDQDDDQVGDYRDFLMDGNGDACHVPELELDAGLNNGLFSKETSFDASNIVATAHPGKTEPYIELSLNHYVKHFGTTHLYGLDQFLTPTNLRRVLEEME